MKKMVIIIGILIATQLQVQAGWVRGYYVYSYSGSYWVNGYYIWTQRVKKPNQKYRDATGRPIHKTYVHDFSALRSQKSGKILYKSNDFSKMRNR